MPMKERAVWGILLMSSLITMSQSTRLNVPKLLLPLSTRVPVNITLTAQRGCYKWVSSKPETVRVYPLSAISPPDLLPMSSCSQQCLVSALSSPQAVPTHSVVQAQDPVMGHILRCDVIIDYIERIQIITTTRQLFTDDPPLQLSIQAFDTEGLYVTMMLDMLLHLISCLWRNLVRGAIVSCCTESTVAQHT